MNYPALVPIRQHFERVRVTNLRQAVHDAFESLNLGQRVRPGHTVALTAGSRGIANIPVILKLVVEYLQHLGAKPFIVPAMGSHGGATAEGQVQLLARYGITEASVSAPIRSSMEVVSLGTTSEGYPLFFDSHAARADHVGVVARVKPHTSFHGPIESGLLKMMMIGLGKHVGALAYHRILFDKPWPDFIRSVGGSLLKKAPIAFGLALVENAYEETALIEGVAPANFESREEQLLMQARRWMGRLPIDEADLLIIDEIGKDISGSGMDTNVIGRKRARNEAADQTPNVRQIFVRGLSQRTHGNATGIGVAEFTTRRLIDAMDYRATVINCLTAGYPDGAKLPVHFPTDREAIDAALALLGSRETRDARILHIRNTLDLETLHVSEPVVAERHATELTIEGPAQPFAFDPAGNL